MAVCHHVPTCFGGTAPGPVPGPGRTPTPTPAPEPEEEAELAAEDCGDANEDMVLCDHQVLEKLVAKRLDLDNPDNISSGSAGRTVDLRTTPRNPGEL